MVYFRDAREKIAMSERDERSHGREERGSAESKDITPMLKGWDYETGSINVRKIVGIDGKEKLQMRLDLGLLQMEVHGRPDGVRPHGRESYLEYFEDKLDRYKRENGSVLGFALSESQ